MSIKNIKLEFDNIKTESIPDLIEKYSCDERSGVQKILKAQQAKYDKYCVEINRVKGTKNFELELSKKVPGSPHLICGIDEVGRGPLAGPVVASAVIMPDNFIYPYINDSKKVSEKKREELDKVIRENAISYAVGIVDEKVIDDVNILQATYQAMRQVISKLDPEPTVLINDAVTIPGVGIPQIPVIKGDAKCFSIACASIIAKVYRDNLMREYDKIYPEYGFAKNKGYGSSDHIEAVKKYGPTPIHRKTFIKNFV